MKTFKLLKKVAIGMVAIPLCLLLLLATLLLVPIFWPISAYQDRKTEKAMRAAWLPNKKYVLIAYEKGSEWAEFIHDNLLPKYGKHILVQAIDIESPAFKAAESIELRAVKDLLIQHDCGCVSNKVVGHNDLGLLLMTPKNFVAAQWVGDHDDSSTPLTKKTFEEKIQETIALWG